ncbi:MAG TPA: prolyl oligopeptidase family serine peptidase [Actinomycetota bacterium]|nr:prolyl oligopeptidase family serine peptidase [Actinomycetota bacterium]
MSEGPAWKRRFTAPRFADFTFAPSAPDRWAAVTNESGSWQAWSWDGRTGRRERVSTEGIGAEEVHLTPAGDGVVWWRDDTGDERGRWIVTPFGGGDGRPLADDVPEGWTMGLSLVDVVVAQGLATDDDYRVYLSRDGEPSRELYRHTQPAGVGAEWPQGGGGLSADAAHLCIRHAEHGDIERQALRVLDVATGATIADLDDGARTGAVAWSPIGGDARLAGWSEVSGFERPFVWDVRNDERRDLDVPLDAAVFPLAWYPTGDALLLRHAARGYDALYRFDLGDGRLTQLLDPHGTVNAGWVRPDGAAWAWIETSADPPRIVDDHGEEVATLSDERQPAGRPFRPFSFRNPAGDEIHAFVVTPEGQPPFPTILSVHGGPNWHHTDAFDPDAQAFVDHGYAVVLVNYRGSTGYGRAFRDALQGNIGFPESEDVNAALDHLIADGIVDPDRLCLEGWSWGGYQATLNAGLRPDRWKAVVAGIPVGDYVAAHYECAPALRAWDVAVMGGSPMDVPELYAERNPMTYVDRVRAPMLMIAGEHDSRCPLGQVMVYAHALKVRGRHVDVHTYPGGHHALATEQKLRHIEMTIAFFDRALGDAAPARSR